MSKKNISKSATEKTTQFVIDTMPSPQSYQSRKAWEGAAWTALTAHITRQSDSTVITDLLDILLTTTERKNVLMRSAAITFIQSGKSYREIGRELWLSPQTISGLKKALRERTYRSYQERSKTERKKKQYDRTPPSRTTTKRRVRTKYGTIEVGL